MACPSCGIHNATFSKSQRRKNIRDRKCKLCVEKLLGQSPSPKIENKYVFPGKNNSDKSFIPVKGGKTVEVAIEEEIDCDRLRSRNDDTKKEDASDHVEAKKTSVSASDKSLTETDVTTIMASASRKEESHDYNAVNDTNSATVRQLKNYDELEDSDSEEEFCDQGNWSPMQGVEEDDSADISLKHLAQTSKNLKEDTSEGRKRETIREKMKKAREKALSIKQQNQEKLKITSDDGSDKSHKDVENVHYEQDVSLEALKHKIMGRKISSMYDMENESQLFSPVEPSKLIMEPSAFTDGTTVANHLRQDLTCPICHDRLYNPVSLMCGHSFCRTCLIWWLNQSDIMRNEDGRWDESSVNDATTSRGGTCPSCRTPIPAQQKGKMSLFQINTALKACMDTLYGSEMNQRRLAEERQKRKATSGEAGGIHQKGCEVLVPLPEEDERELNRNDRKDEENGWISIFASSSRPALQRKGSGINRGCGANISIRRNNVLDDRDRRYQMSLGLTKCSYSKEERPKGDGRVIDVELCLLAMEEDEVDDSGFPAIVIEGSDDEALICTDNDCIYSCIESCARILPVFPMEKANESFSILGKAFREPNIEEIPLARGMIDISGSVRFRFDVKKILESAKIKEGDTESRLVKVKFCHIDTGAVLELRLPSTNSDDDIEFGPSCKPRARTDALRYFMDEDDDEEEEHDENVKNEYEEDGFLVGDYCESEEENDEADDENDECYICNNGGDLIVCDGGDHAGGCGHAFHLNCINRNEVPPGEIGNNINYL